MLAFLAPNISHGNTDTQTSANELEQLRQNISTLKQELGGDKQRQHGHQKKLSDAEKQIADLSRKQRKIKSELIKQQKAQQTLVKETHHLRQKLVQQQENLSQQIRAGYSAGKQQALKMLLNQTDPGSAGRNMTYYAYFTRAQLNAVEETQLNIKQLKNAETQLQTSNERLTELNRKYQKQTYALQEQQANRKIILSKLNTEINSKERQLNKLIDDEKALSAVLNRLIPKTPPTTNDFSDLGKLKGKLSWPTKGRLQNHYGQARNQSGMKWQGIIIKGNEGQDVRAIAPGQVIFADWIRGYGLMLIVDHGKGYLSLYGHNQSLYKDVGDAVTRNEVISALGNSGGNNTTSLYFEMRHKGKTINPETWCR